MKDLKNLEIGEYFRILWRRKYYCLATFVLVAAGAFVYAWRMPDVFKSETRIRVDEPIGSDVGSALRMSSEDRINSIREQLASRTFLERLIEQYQMFGYGKDPGFVMENALRAVQRRIRIDKTSNNTFTISFVATEPQFAQTFTRQLAQEVIRISNSSRKDRVLATDQFIDEQLRQSAELLKAQEEKIAKFKLQHLGELPQQSSANMSALTGLHSQLSTVESAIQQAQERQKLLDFNYQERKRLSEMSQKLATAGIEVKPEGIVRETPTAAEAELKAKKSQIEQYLARYTSSHPDVVRLARDIERLEQQVKEERSARRAVTAEAGEKTGSEEIRTASISTVNEDALEAAYQFQTGSIKNEIAKRENERQELLRQIKIYQNRLNLAPALEQELTTLMREADILRARYETLQKQKFSTEMATNVETDIRNETYRVIDEANLPVKPEAPNRLHMILIGIGGGLVLGIGAAYGREMLDTTIGSEQEAKRVLNLPVLATISTVPGAKKTA